MSTHRSRSQVLSIIVILTMLFSGFSLPAASAQGGDGVERQVNAQTGKVSFIGPEDGQTVITADALGTNIRPQDPALALAKRFAPEFGLMDAEQELAEVKDSRSENGRITTRYQQKYQGIPVMGGELIVNTNVNGDLYSMNGEVSPNLSLSTQPTIDAEQAKQTALQAMAKWYQKTTEEFRTSDPELWIYDESLLLPSTRPVELVWRMEVTAVDDSLPVRELVLVNAQRGGISLHFNQIDTAWSLQGNASAIQDPDPTPTLTFTETPISTETSLVPTETSVPTETVVATQTPLSTETSLPTETVFIAETPVPTETLLPTETIEPTTTLAPTQTPIYTEEASASTTPVNDGPTLAGATWYVATTGNNSNSCTTPASPCATIDGAIVKAITDDIVKVATGTYTSTTGNVVTINRGITLSGGWNAAFTAQNEASIIDGGGVRNGVLVNAPRGVSVVIDHFVIRNSTAPDSGGIYLFASTLTLKNSSIVNNLAGRGAGIFMISNPVLNIENSTISGNTAGSSGGGLYVDSGTVTVNNSTIAYNHSNGVGGGITQGTGSVTLLNSILAKNTATTNGTDCSGVISSNGNLILGNATGCTISGGTDNKLGVDPLLDSSLTGTLPLHVLQAGSPAIDSGNDQTCLTIDQRGMPRGAGCDIGAYEYAPNGALGIVSGSGQITNVGSAFAAPLTVSLVDGSLNPVSGASITFTAPASGASGIFADTGTRSTTATTNSSGQATSSLFTANAFPGSYVVTVTVAGFSETVNFYLTNHGGFYVATTGSDSNSCLAPASPCATIQAAVDKATAGNIIKVAAGIYTGTGDSVVTITKALVLSGGWDHAFNSQSGHSTIDGQNTRIAIQIGGAGNTIDHFIIANGYTASEGAGINSFGPLILNNSIVTNNRSTAGTWSAGGIYAKQDLTINNSIIEGNFSDEAGGIRAEANLTLNTSTVRSNTSDMAGGIMIYGFGTLTIKNSTITGNRAAESGGGILLSHDSETSRQLTRILNSTIANNTAGIYGGGIFIGPRSGGRVVTVKNSIIANNHAKQQGSDCWGTINTLDHSLIRKTNHCTLSPGNGNILYKDPLISTFPVGPIGYHSLAPASPAIDTGANCLSTDQRDVSRPQGSGCDMGAYEFTVPGSAASFGMVSGSNQNSGTLLSFSKPLVVYVVDALGSPVSGVNVTFTAPDSGPSGSFANTGTHTATVPTNDSGRAIAPTFTANAENGSYNVSATVSGLPGSVIFSLTNATWYVSPAGNNANSCSSPVSPCLTINGAILKASEGDDIQVATGSYTGNSSPVVNITKGLTLSGGWDELFNSQNGKSIIDGSGFYDGIHINAIGEVIDKVTISNFIVKKSTRGIDNKKATLIFANGAVINSNQGIVNWRGNLSLLNITISGNQHRTGTGSAINNTFGTVSIQYSTITNNSGYVNNAIWNVNGGEPIKIGNSILAGNEYRDCRGDLTSLGNNIFGSSPVCVGSVVIKPSDKVGFDPKLFPLHPGGYHPLVPGSPAINGATLANCPAADQRNASRPAGVSCDIGAFEHVGSGTVSAYILAYKHTPQDLAFGAMSRIPLKAVVLDEDGDIVPGARVTFTSPASGASSIFTTTNTATATVLTNTNGLAVSPILKANTVKGSYLVYAAVDGVPSPASFQFKNISQPVETYTADDFYILPGTILCKESNIGCTKGRDPHGDRAHLFTIGTANLYLNKHDRGGINGYGMPILSSVHYCSYDVRIPCPYPNAFWNGEQMVYGDAFGFPLADDVVAHELTHAVTKYESNLFYYYQAGAINESFSDLWGEYYDQTNGMGNDSATVKWLIGENVSKQGAIRSMSNPPAYKDPDKMSNAFYYEGAEDSGGVHTNSGVNNKAVFLMVNGGTFNGRTVTALGWDKTAAIYYEVNTNLLPSGADYSDLYYALPQACKTLIGEKGITAANCREVRDAIDAVEMNKQPAPNFNPHAPLCTVKGTVPKILFADDLETGIKKWRFNNYGTYVRWQWDSPYGPYAQSGNHSLYADDHPDGNEDASAKLVALTVPGNAYLHFAHAYDFERGYITGKPTLYNFDGGVLEYSINNGATWRDAGSLIDYNGYKGKVYSGFHNPLGRRSAFVGSSHGYISTRLNLASLAGKKVTFRWRMGLDGAGYAWGWWVDNVKLYTCGVP